MKPPKLVHFKVDFCIGLDCANLIIQQTGVPADGCATAKVTALHVTIGFSEEPACDSPSDLANNIQQHLERNSFAGWRLSYVYICATLDGRASIHRVYQLLKPLVT